MGPRKKTKHTMAKIEAIESEVGEELERLPSLKSMELIKIAHREMLKGTDARGIHKAFQAKGHHINVSATRRVMKLAKVEIARAGEKDMAVNYGWAQANLMDIHRNAVLQDDDKMRLVTIRQLIELWQLNRPHVEVKDTEITPEMVEEFEQKLLR